MPAFALTTTYGGYTVATGAAEADDKARIDAAMPGVAYFVGARIVGEGNWLCANDPTLAANWGYACPVAANPRPGANGSGT